jgi:hypothetical protein
MKITEKFSKTRVSRNTQAIGHFFPGEAETLRACPTRTLTEALGKKFLAVMLPPVNFPSAATALVF